MIRLEDSPDRFDDEDFTVRTPLFKLSRALTCLLILPNCSSPQFVVDSEPNGAQVVVTSDSHSPQMIGSTPITTSPSAFASGSSSTIVEIKKAGFVSRLVHLPETTFSRSTHIKVKLTEDRVPASCENQNLAVRDVSRGIARAQSLIASKKMDEAMNLLKNLIARFPENPVLYDLIGNIYYMQRELQLALSAYKKSNQIEPGNSETENMIEKIKLISGDRSPAEAGT
ncbi:MAG: hypothetical protein COT74_04885 [Bdellovibrionales bacterium CG10_big_fil_rev_8_21_14_0_10_45_34]|nr:MAG: hypothetical protein COT74_04885 [Bdellovibrionales bacterium CG10_big_fil_rev_8_21_14_0_10_45_34]